MSNVALKQSGLAIRNVVCTLLNPHSQSISEKRNGQGQWHTTLVILQ